MHCGIRPALRLALTLVAIIAGVVHPAGTVSAHTGFESSTPADGQTVEAPVATVTVAFTGEAEPVGERFVALNGDGQRQEPTDVVVDESRIFTLTFDPPLAGGAIGVRWEVAAPDTHSIAGSFSFEVAAPAVTTVPADVTSPPSSAPPVAESIPEVVDSIDADPEAAVPATTLEPPASSPPQPTSAGEKADDSGTTAVALDDDPPVATPTLEEFLAVEQTRPGERVSLVGRVISLPAIVLAVGALAFAALAFRGSRDEASALYSLIRALGVVIALGAIVEYIGVGRVLDVSFGSVWSESAGRAVILRLVGGVLLAFGVASSLGRRASARALSASVVDNHTDSNVGLRRETTVVGGSTGALWFAGLAVAMLVASFWFDGHTVTKGFRPLHALSNSVHVLAGSVWVGGVVAMAIVMWGRHRRGRPADAAAMIVRFSRVATIALGAVAVAGLVMAVSVLDSFGELTGTEWGRILLLKTAAVAVAVAIGAYNHFVLLPAIDADPGSVSVAEKVRVSLTTEGIVLLFVVVVTAWLVAAAS